MLQPHCKHLFCGTAQLPASHQILDQIQTRHLAGSDPYIILSPSEFYAVAANNPLRRGCLRNPPGLSH